MGGGSGTSPEVRVRVERRHGVGALHAHPCSLSRVATTLGFRPLEMGRPTCSQGRTGKGVPSNQRTWCPTAAEPTLLSAQAHSGWGLWVSGTSLPQDWPNPPAPQVQSELLRCWHHWREGKALQKRPVGSHAASAQPTGGPCSEKLLLSIGGASNRASQDHSSETRLADSLPVLAESPI